jgi:hypothetical protein
VKYRYNDDGEPMGPSTEIPKKDDTIRFRHLPEFSGREFRVVEALGDGGYIVKDLKTKASYAIRPTEVKAFGMYVDEMYCK